MFSVVTMIKEEPEILGRFVDYYLQLGADHIYIWFDGEEGGDVFRDAPIASDRTRCSVFSMSNQDWIDAVGKENETDFDSRHDYIHMKTQNISVSKWLLTVDADEFFWPDGSVDGMLESLPPSVVSLQVPVAEAVWGPEDMLGQPFACTYFRKPLRRRAGRKMRGFLRRNLPQFFYGANAEIFPDNTAGHSAGRHFFRADVQFGSIGPHNAKQNGEYISVLAKTISPEFAGHQILHYDAISFDRWVTKIARRVEKKVSAKMVRETRLTQFLDFEEAFMMKDKGQREAKLLSLFSKLYQISPRQVRRMRLFGSVFRAHPFDVKR